MASSYHQDKVNLTEPQPNDDSDDVKNCLATSEINGCGSSAEIALKLVTKYKNLCEKRADTLLRDTPLGKNRTSSAMDGAYKDDTKYRTMQMKYGNIGNYGYEALEDFHAYLKTEASTKALSELWSDEVKLFLGDSVLHNLYEATVWKYFGAGFEDNDPKATTDLGWLKPLDDYERYWRARVLRKTLPAGQNVAVVKHLLDVHRTVGKNALRLCLKKYLQQRFKEFV